MSPSSWTGSCLVCGPPSERVIRGTGDDPCLWRRLVLHPLRLARAPIRSPASSNASRCPPVRPSGGSLWLFLPTPLATLLRLDGHNTASACSLFRGDSIDSVTPGQIRDFHIINNKHGCRTVAATNVPQPISREDNSMVNRSFRRAELRLYARTREDARLTKQRGSSADH
jgi:hypothetical protein